MEKFEINKSEMFTTTEVLMYVPRSIVIKTILRKATGFVTVVACDTGETLSERTSPFDNFIQVVEGHAEILINGISHLMEAGQSIIIPAHARNTIHAHVCFKMISTVIKSGYED